MIFKSNYCEGKMKFKNYNFLPFNKQMNSVIDQKLLPLGKCSAVYNFSTNTGALVDGIGIGELEFIMDNYNVPSYKKINLPENTFLSGAYFIKFWDTKTNLYQDLLILYGGNRKMYFNQINAQFTECIELPGFVFNQKPISLYTQINGEDCLIFYSQEDGMYVWNIINSLGFKVDNPPKITSMCIHDGRLFATIDGESRSIIYSEDLNPINFNVSEDEGGYIDILDNFGGRCNKVISFDGYLYVFRDYNIVRISESKDRNDFVLTQIYAGNGRICPKTISVCGDRVIFLATDGLYEFNGSITKKIDLEFENTFDFDRCNWAVSEYSNGKYYLACVMNFYDDIYGCEADDFCHNNALLCININNYDCEILRGCDISDFTLINDGVNNSILASYYFDDKYRVGVLKNNGAIENIDLKKCWRSEYFDFDMPNKDKLIKEISLVSKADIDLNVYFDNKKKTYHIDGENSIQTIKLNIKAKSIRFEFVSISKNNYVSMPQIKVGFYEEIK